jgi:predicted nucleotidyltransferase
LKAVEGRFSDGFEGRILTEAGREPARGWIKIVPMERPAGSLVSALREILQGRADVELAVLFGSRARGRHRAGSDVDLAVRGRGLDRLALARDLSLALDLEFDVVDLDRATIPLSQAILRDAVIVHQGSPGAGGRWLAATVAALETDLPGYERMRDAYLRRLSGGLVG